MSLLVITLFQCGLTVVLVGLIRGYAQQHLIDAPNARSSHSIPTPRGGGLGSVLAYVLVGGYYFLVQQISLPYFTSVVIGLAIAGVGFMDDHQHVPAKWRMLVQITAASAAVFCLPVPEFFMTAWLGYGLAVLFITWCINLFNFMDGIDGIAGVEAVFVASVLGYLLWPSNTGLALLAISLASVSMGFLLWNWPPAKIFMGDVGSGYLGFILGVLLLQAAETDLAIGCAGLIAFAVFVVDASLTLVQRILSGQKFYQAHCSHAYQHAAKRYGHLNVLVVVCGINILYLFPLAMLASAYPQHAWMYLLIAYLPLIGVAYKFRAGRVHG